MRKTRCRLTQALRPGAVIALLVLVSGCVLPGQAQPAAGAPAAPAVAASRPAIPTKAASAAAATTAGASTGEASSLATTEASAGSAEGSTAMAQDESLAAAALDATPAVLPAAGAAGPGQAAVSSPQPQGTGSPYLLPKPDSTYNPPGTTIAVRYGDTMSPAGYGSYFHVSGSASGPHSGSVVLSDDSKTLIFKPDAAFAAGETVSVAVDPWTSGSGSAHPAVSFTFSTVPAGAPEAMSTAGSLTPQNSAPADSAQSLPPGLPQYVTVPADFPVITATVTASTFAPGYIFASNFQLKPGPSGYYLMILDNGGQPVYYQKLAGNTMALDFKVQPNGTLSYADRTRNVFVVMDSSYREIDTIAPGNGYTALDYHDLQLLPNGHYLLMVNEARTYDLSKVVQGGKANASVTGQVIQELDKNKNVVFEWRLLDYLPVTDTDQDLSAQEVDFSHANSVAVDNDGNLLVSIRHTDEVVKVNRTTGAIMWRMGGKDNQFAFTTAPGVNGPAQFYHQHDVRRLPNGHITMFDNHNDHEPQVSRAAEYVVDENAKTATLVWSWDPDPAPWSAAMGNVQRLDNGDTMISWGTDLGPDISEVRPDGWPAIELDFSGTNVTYRAFRFPWQGNPTWPPALVALLANGGLTLTFSWNGATQVASYRVAGGEDAAPAIQVGEQPKTGFETSVTLTGDAANYCFYQVTPVDGQGNAMQQSAAVANPARAIDAACTPAAAASALAAP